MFKSVSSSYLISHQRFKYMGWIRLVFSRHYKEDTGFCSFYKNVKTQISAIKTKLF
jgi:hypothetical protein